MTVRAGEPLWISEADVVAMMDLRDAIRAVETGLEAEARGEAKNMQKTHVAWDGGTLHAIGASFPGIAGTKTWAHTEGGATPLLILYDATTGALQAVIEAFALGQMRTGAVSGVATRWLAAEGADEMAIAGTGKQALAQVAAVAAVRAIRRVHVYSPSEQHRAAFVARVRAELGIDAIASPSIADAVKNVPIITTITRAREPFLTAAMIAPGTHINAVGAIVPTGAEVAADAVARCARIVADSVPQAQKLARELSAVEWSKVQPLSTVVAARQQRSAAEITLFKSLGMGISDLSLGAELHRLAVELGLGRPIPRPRRVAPRLRSTPAARRIEERRFIFLDQTGQGAPLHRPQEPVVIRREEIAAEVERLAALPRPGNGRRASLVVNPVSGVGNGLAPGTAVLLSVLNPGERTPPVRHNVSQINFCIGGEGTAVVDGKRIDFAQYDVWNIPPWVTYEHRNDSDSIQVRLTYSNAALLEKLNVHVVEEELERARHPERSEGSPDATSSPPRSFADAQDDVVVTISADGASLMPYEKLISPDVVRMDALHWPWARVREELDKLTALGPAYSGRRLYLLYNPATGRTNGTSHTFFATLCVRPANIIDRPHRHTASAINYFFKGRGWSIVEGKRHEWKAGDLMLTAPGWAIHHHCSYDEDVYELTIQDSPLQIAMGSLLWQEDLKEPPEVLGATGGFATNRSACEVRKR